MSQDTETIGVSRIEMIVEKLLAVDTEEGGERKSVWRGGPPVASQATTSTTSSTTTLVNRASFGPQQATAPLPIPSGPPNNTVPRAPVIDLCEDSYESNGKNVQDALKKSLEEARGAGEGDVSPAVLPDLRTDGGGGKVTGVSKEEEDISKAIEASMRADTVLPIRDVCEDPNPYNRQRIAFSWPVGLRNIGNSCWFSVVIQALFHLPAFRNRILTWDMDFCSEPQPSTSQGETSQREEFMSELRKLFALLLASNRKYVDPSKVFRVLKRHERHMNISDGLYNNQQDVSEFTHCLLDWIEEVFRAKSFKKGMEDLPVSNSEGPQSVERGETRGDVEAKEGDYRSKLLVSPVQELFYGSKEETKRTCEGEVVESRETEFAQYMLTVAGCRTFHDSMEESLCPKLEGEQPQSTSYEHWITRLPPVFLFELNRFDFNHKEKTTEKVHSVFRFPKEIFMDRYLSANKELVR